MTLRHVHTEGRLRWDRHIYVRCAGFLRALQASNRHGHGEGAVTPPTARIFEKHLGLVVYSQTAFCLVAGCLFRRLIILISIGVTGCEAQGHPLDIYVGRVATESGIAYEEMGDGRMLLVINCTREGPQWFLLGNENKLIGTASGGRSVMNLKISDSGRWLAVATVGEGDSGLVVVDVEDLLEDQWNVVLQVDPYPGGIRVKRWEGDRLLVESDMLLRGRGNDRRVLGDMQLSRWESFSLDPHTGETRPERPVQKPSPSLNPAKNDDNMHREKEKP